MNIKITKSTELPHPELTWYATEIGKMFEVYSEQDKHFIVWTGVEDMETGNEMIGRVSKDDCVIAE